MTKYGFHASHEQISPRQLLGDVQRAERAGFEIAMCSDHFAPWSRRQDHSGFAWSWLGAALATTELPLGTVSAPGQRYHPAIIAQASATLAQMFPGRFWVALGSGQHMNEHITGQRWPHKQHRQERLEECAAIIRALHRGEEVTHSGHVVVDRARLYSLPAQPPALIAPALSPGTAERAAAWADGLITINDDPDSLRQIIDAYRGAGGTGPLAIQVHLSVADSMDAAWAMARDQWQNHALAKPLQDDLPIPEYFDMAGRHVPDDEVADAVLITDDVAQLVGWLREYAELGFEEIYLHHVGQDQRPFLDLAESELLPALRGA